MATSIICLMCSAANSADARHCQVCGTAVHGEPAHDFGNALPLGTQLVGGRYAVGRVLGQGGFGITYLGSDAQQRRTVAIKEFFLYGSLRSGTEVRPATDVRTEDYSTSRENFLNEAHILSRFGHPGIVDVYDSFQENNTAYVVMEYLRGRSLGNLMEEHGPLPEREAVDYITRTGEALAIVHGASLLHRDLKPDNIMLTDDGRVVLIDFGTARTFVAGRTGRMTTMVTPGYAPLEQYGHQVRFGPFTDIYALAATLYHLLTGQMPVPATDRASGVDLHAPRVLDPTISAEVSDAIMWALEMRVDQRPQIVGALLDALNAARVATVPASPAVQPVPVPQAPPRARAEAGVFDVEVEGDGARWPVDCACCLGPADSTYLVEASGRGGPFNLFLERRSWEVPYCSDCLAHLRLAEAPTKNEGGGLAGLAPLAALVLGGRLGWRGMLMSLGGVALDALRNAMKQPDDLKSQLKPTCVAFGPAATYRGWSGNTHAFTFVNRDYAEAFRQENAASLVA